MMSDDHLTTDHSASIQSAIQEFEEGRLQFEQPALTFQSLARTWGLEGIPQWPTQPTARYLRETRAGVFRYRTRVERLARPQWDLALSSEFRKAIQGIDRKLQGRILQAIDYISTKPTIPKGDTVKPLGGELKGLWRYRIGDYRLVYQPDPDNGRVVLLTFVSRGDAYA